MFKDLRVRTIGNASLIVYEGDPILVCDPWIGDEDPAYFGSWMLSHQIPTSVKEDILNSKFVFFSHGHPDHLNPLSLPRFKEKKILIPDHVGSRIFNDISSMGYDVSILPDRKWVKLSEDVKILCITTYIQDSILLIDVNGKLFINLNDSAARNCSAFIRSISKNYKDSYLLTLAGYGDVDMINFYDEDNKFIRPMSSFPVVGRQLNNYAKLTGAKSVVPFSSFHQYQRSDSHWAQSYTTPINAYSEGFDHENYNYIPPFSSIDCNSLEVLTETPKELIIELKSPENFGDCWSDELEERDRNLISDYFARKERVKKYFGFVNFNVGGNDYTLKMDGPKGRGISFSVPRGSLITSIEYRIFDDLLIGNFMKTTLIGCASLYEGSGNFNFNVAKYADNGLAETEEEITRYLNEYKKRAGSEFVIDMLADQAKSFFSRFLGSKSRGYDLLKQFYFNLR
jgi:hypothetical protein